MVKKQNKHQLEHLPILLVQQLRLQWYKDCRGGNAAAQRTSIPERCGCLKTSSLIIPLAYLLTLHLSYRGPMDFGLIGTVAG